MRTDTMWRDPHLALWHAARGIPFPAAGMTLPMVEYDRGAPVGLISYIRRDVTLPTGGDSYLALASLYSVNGNHLPFITAVYDPFNWAFRLIGHNHAGRKLLGTEGWRTCTEQYFVGVLYQMRGRLVPDLESYGVHLSNASWYEDCLTVADEDQLPWQNADMSQRRRAYEPVRADGRSIRFNMLNPCADIDLAVSSGDGRLRLLVDYKGPGARVNTANTTHLAIGSLYRRGGYQVAYMVARTRSDEPGVEILPVNSAARKLTNMAEGEWRPLEWSAWAAFLAAMAS